MYHPQQTVFPITVLLYFSLSAKFSLLTQVGPSQALPMEISMHFGFIVTAGPHARPFLKLRDLVYAWESLSDSIAESWNNHSEPSTAPVLLLNRNMLI